MPHPNKASELSRAWLAGLLEGEGSFKEHWSGRNRGVRISLKMTDLDVVQRAAKIMENGEPIHIGVRKPNLEGAMAKSPFYNPEKWKDCYEFSVGGYHSREWMRELRPYMGERRQQKISELLSMWSEEEKQGELFR